MPNTTTSGNTRRRSALFDTETPVVSTSTIAQQQHGGHTFKDKRKKKKKKSKDKKRAAGSALERLMAVLFSVVLTVMMTLCVTDIVHTATSNEQRKTKEEFMTVKRKPLKTYLDERLPAQDLQRQPIQLNWNQQAPQLSQQQHADQKIQPLKRRVLGRDDEPRTKRQQSTTREIIDTNDTNDNPNEEMKPRDPHQKILTAYLESPATLQEDVKPLPLRKTSRELLRVQEYPQVQQCSTFLQDFGQHVVDNFPSGDPYLPWLHDIFPNPQGTQLHFIAQNRRNCLTGEGMYSIMKHWKPQIALFQPVPVLQLEDHTFQLATSLQNATHPETRFLCQFHNHQQSITTLSVFPFNYEFVSWRKRGNMLEPKDATSKEALNQSPFWVSQLLFTCPIPPSFQSLLQQSQEQPNLWVDLIPIRTPARTSDQVLLTPEMVGSALYKKNARNVFQLEAEYGPNHTLPAMEDSGRWANLPICPVSTPKPTQQQQSTTTTQKIHRLVACTWTSSSYQRRGNAVTVRDSHQRLREWILFHRMVGFDHLVVYDNSPNTTHTSTTLESVTLEFSPDLVTYMAWPCKVCSNNRPMNKNPGDRSSQYAAEASCRERFGPFTEWMSFIDTDEYLVPMKHETWTNVLDEMELKNIQVLKMRSSRGLPRHDLMQPLADQGACEIPVKRSAAVRKLKPKSCQEPNPHETFLKVYNCDYIKPPRPDRFARAMKQIYRPSYVLSHFVHYSTVTKDVARYQKDQPNADKDDTLLDYKAVGADKEIFLNELEQGTLIHARSVLPHETIYRSDMCKSNSKHKCPLGYVCPNSTEWIDDKVRPNSLNPFVDDRGHYCNCWINEQVEKVMVPKLEAEWKKHMEAMGTKKSVQ